jgi:hypothetical protein
VSTAYEGVPNPLPTPTNESYLAKYPPQPTYVDQVSPAQKARAQEAIDEMVRVSNEYPGCKDTRVAYVDVTGEQFIRGKDQGVIGTWNSQTGVMVLATGRAKGGEDHLTLKQWNTCKGIRGTARHEFGHATYDKISTASRQAWRDMIGNTSNLNAPFQWATSKGAALAKSVSKYAAKNSHELFAESFAAYTHPSYKGSAKQLPAPIHSYMEQHIGGKS